MAGDLDPVEAREWLDSLGAVLEFNGAGRAYCLLDELIGEARCNGAAVPYSANSSPRSPTLLKRAQEPPTSRSPSPAPSLSETVGLAAEAFEGTITDLYLPKKK
jgi:hypothetical protein